MTIEELWNVILSNEDKTVYTKTGLPFDYERVGHDKIRIYRNDEAVGIVSKENIQFILDNPNLPRADYRDAMRTSSYALALVFEFNN